MTMYGSAAPSKLITLSETYPRHQPLVALLLPEKQDVSHEIARHFAAKRVMRWNGYITAADSGREQVLAELGSTIQDGGANC